MRTASSYFIIAVVLGLALTLGAVPALAETTACTPITAVPTTITVQGIYCFTQHLNTGISSGAAIDIQTNNVILDLNGFKLGGLAAGPGTLAVGITAVNRQNITIKNGTVRGFFQGILLDGSAGQGHVVEDIRADQNTFIGMEVHGNGSLIRNNQVVATGGSTVFGPEADAFGIKAAGSGPRVLNNAVIDTQSQGGALAKGIEFIFAHGALAVSNRIINADFGIHYVQAGDPAESSTGKYRDNLTFGVPTATRFLFGTPVGIND